eukprot:scaffold4868_cov416-Prasinococcus_capsulatus_cf.AAC.7
MPGVAGPIWDRRESMPISPLTQSKPRCFAAGGRGRATARCDGRGCHRARQAQAGAGLRRGWAKRRPHSRPWQMGPRGRFSALALSSMPSRSHPSAGPPPHLACAQFGCALRASERRRQRTRTRTPACACACARVQERSPRRAYCCGLLSPCTAFERARASAGDRREPLRPPRANAPDGIGPPTDAGATSRTPARRNTLRSSELADEHPPPWLRHPYFRANRRHAALHSGRSAKAPRHALVRWQAVMCGISIYVIHILSFLALRDQMKDLEPVEWQGRTLSKRELRKKLQ